LLIEVSAPALSTTPAGGSACCHQNVAEAVKLWIKAQTHADLAASGLSFIGNGDENRNALPVVTHNSRQCLLAQKSVFNFGELWLTLNRT